jgi:hypothetical protein
VEFGLLDTMAPFLKKSASGNVLPYHNTRCGFPETGTYSYLPGTSGCPDPFMSMSRAGPSPCGARCCRPDHDGDFTPFGAIPGIGTPRHTFQPTDAQCRYAELSRGQVLHYLRTHGSDVVVAGDSMMRQFYLRLVMMMRGQPRLLDYHLHAHAQYAVCGEADAFRISAPSSNASHINPDFSYMNNRVPAFFRAEVGPGALALRRAMARCSRRPVELHYMHAPRFKGQATSLARYFDAAQPGSSPVLLVGVGYWENGGEVPQQYLETLAELRTRARKVFVVSIPTVRVPVPERAEWYRERNTFMRAWVEAQGEPFAFLDYDGIGRAAHPPPGGANNNWHYMCSLAWRVNCTACDLVQIDRSNRGGGEDGITPTEQIPRGSVEGLYASDDGQCTDEMNRNLWQVVFNALVPPAKGGAGGRRRRRL